MERIGFPVFLAILTAVCGRVDRAAAQPPATTAAQMKEASCVVLPLQTSPTMATGNARLDLVPLPDIAGDDLMQQEGQPMPVEGQKSIWLAGGCSAVLPGAGEWYAESYWKSAAFFAAEITLWTVALIYDHKGDKQTDFFQNYANQHWSVVRYAEFALGLAPPGGQYDGLVIPGTEGRPPWERVNWDVLNRLERDIGGYFSHVLPPYGEQQYFELIGKYPQFNQGWDDAAPTFTYGDPLTTEFLYYSGERGKANTYYDRASTMMAIVVVNHIVSAVDAALTAHSYNNSLHASVGARTVPTDRGWRTVPALSLRYEF
jgi:hypothetical protein